MQGYTHLHFVTLPAGRFDKNGLKDLILMAWPLTSPDFNLIEWPIIKRNLIENRK